MIGRLLLASAVMLGGAGYVAHATQEERVPPHEALKSLPLEIGKWEGHDGPPFEPRILTVLGVDEYLNRMYLTRREPFVNLYVGFYESQRQGDTMHSPLNCLPGAGWQPVEQARTPLSVTNANGQRSTIVVNQFVIEKGLDRQLVLYWYQSHGRVVASEYTSRFYMAYDAMRLNRTDAAMVRVVTPITGTDPADEEAAVQRAREFVEALFPKLSTVLPG